MAARTKKPPEPPKLVTRIYGYHPANDIADLSLPTSVVKGYHVAETAHRNPIDPSLEWNILHNGVKSPLQIATNGLYGLIIDGNHRLRIAVKLELEEVPVQVIPDNLARKATRRGFAVVEPLLSAWVAKNLFTRHDGHDVARHMAGGADRGGIAPNQYMRCVCDCGARWREYY